MSSPPEIEERTGRALRPRARHAIIRVGCVGLGYWGPNVLRCFVGLTGCQVVAACDADSRRVHQAKAIHPHLRLVTEYGALLDDPRIDAIVITTPSSLHSPMAMAALHAGKHVFVEKPVALSTVDAEKLVELARAKELILMVGHLLKYHPAVRHLKGLIRRGHLGKIHYVYSNRVNLGQVRREESALWSLAPHDISVILYLLDQEPIEVRAVGGSYLQPEVEDVVFLHLRFEDGVLAHIHVSWLDPHRVRKLPVVGTKRMVVFDDMELSEKIRIYNKGFDRWRDFKTFSEFLTLRNGSTSIPKVKLEEPLKIECRHFLDCIRTGRQPLSDGIDGLKVLQVLEAAAKSLRTNGLPVELVRASG